MGTMAKVTVAVAAAAGIALVVDAAGGS